MIGHHGRPEFRFGVKLESSGKDIETPNYFQIFSAELNSHHSSHKTPHSPFLQNTRKDEILQQLKEGGRYPGFLFTEGKNQYEVQNVLKKTWPQIEFISDNI